MQKVDPIIIKTSDQFDISATRYQFKEKSQHLIIIGPAAAAPQHYYKNFAAFAAEHSEFDTLTFDYRGVGGSLVGSIKDSKATMSDWGHLDLDGVIEWADPQYDKIFILGHSVCGQVFPLCAHRDRITSVYFVATSSAAVRHWTGFSKLKTLLFWHLIIPVTTSVFGYLPGWAMGGKVSLPKTAAREWRRWGLHRMGIIQDDEAVMERYYNTFNHVHFLGFTDDLLFAPPRGVKALMRAYANAKTSSQFIDPKTLGLKSIGHFGFFKSKYQEKLWTMPIMYFTQSVKSFE